jgi:hypothetical protein
MLEAHSFSAAYSHPCSILGPSAFHVLCELWYVIPIVCELWYVILTLCKLCTCLYFLALVRDIVPCELWYMILLP